MYTIVANKRSLHWLGTLVICCLAVAFLYFVVRAKNEQEDYLHRWVVAINDDNAAIRSLGAQRLGELISDTEFLPVHQTRLRMNIAWELSGMKKPEARAAVPALVRALNHPDIAVQGAAWTALIGIGPYAVEAVPALCEALKRPDGPHEMASNALRSIGPAAVPALNEILKHEKDPEVRSRMMDALTGITRQH